MELKENKLKMVVTGAGRGLGEEIVKYFAKKNFDILFCDINFKRVEKLAEHLIPEVKSKIIPMKVDVSDEGEVVKMMGFVKDEFKRLDIIISNVGIIDTKEIINFTFQEWNRIIQTNLTGYFLLAREASKIMIKQCSGNIIQINSMSGKIGTARNGPYCASKFGGIGLTQSLAVELATYGIRVNAVCPGYMLDSTQWQQELFPIYAKRYNKSIEEVRKLYLERIPLKKPCLYKDVINVIEFLISEKSGYITGQAINVAGGALMS